MVSSPTYDPNLLASHKFTEVQDAWKQLNADQGPAAAQPRHPGDLPAGLDVQAGDRRRGAVERPVHPRHHGQGRHRARPAADLARPGQRERRQLRRQHDHADPGARGLLQRLLRRPSASSSATPRCASRPRSSASTRPTSTTSTARSRAASRPTSTRRRPRCRRSASSTSRRRRCRWRWSASGIANGGTLMRPYVVDEVRAPDLSRAGQDLARRPTAATRSSLVGRARQLTQMMVEVVDKGTGTTAQIPGYQGGRQDRHRAELAGAAAVRLVRVVRARRRPARSPWRCSSRTPAWTATRSPAAGWPRRSRSGSWRR